MGKVRDTIKSDKKAIAQWVGRKLCNHNPMEHRDAKGAGKVISRNHAPMLTREQKAGAWLVADIDGNVLYQMKNGRRFMIEIREMEADEAIPELEVVGY